MSDQPGETRRKVICIEDDPEINTLFNLILIQGGFEVIIAADGKEGLDLMAEAVPDLVLLDLMLPDMDGWAVYNMMKADEAMKDIPVIVVTARADKIDEKIARDFAKVDDYIIKPFTPERLLESIHRVLGKAGAGRSG